MHISATVPLLTAMACFVPMNAAQRSSSSAVRRPPGEHPALEHRGDGGDLFWSDIRACDGDHAFAPWGMDGSGRCSERFTVHGMDVATIAGRTDQLAIHGVAIAFGGGVVADGVRQALAAGTHPADAAGRVADDERIGRDRPGDDRARAHEREVADVAAGDDDGARSDRAAVAEVDGRDQPIVGRGQARRPH